MHSLPPKTSKLPFNRSWWAGLSEGSNSIKITNLFWKISTIPPQNYCVGSNPNIKNFRTWQIIELQIGSSTKKEFSNPSKKARTLEPVRLEIICHNLNYEPSKKSRTSDPQTRFDTTLLKTQPISSYFPP